MGIAVPLVWKQGKGKINTNDGDLHGKTATMYVNF